MNRTGHELLRLFAEHDSRGQMTALVAHGAKPFGALAKSTGPTSTSDDAWDGPAQEANLSNDAKAATLKKAYAWVDPDADPDTKAAYKFVHHFVSESGTVGAASTRACSTGIGVLNGGRGGTTIPSGDRKGVYNHLVGHLRDSGVEDDDLPKLDDMAVAQARAFTFDCSWVDVHANGTAEMKEDPFKTVDAIVQSLSNDELIAFARSHGVELAEHESVSTTHSHEHSAMGSQGDDERHEHEHTHDGDASHDHHSSEATATVTPIRGAEHLAAKIAELRERQRPDVERMTVRLTDLGDLAVELPVRWDEDAWDPFRWDESAGRFGARGAFVSTVTAAADTPQLVDNPGAEWHAVLCVEGLRTDEDPPREIVPGACQVPDLPVSLRLQIHDEGGHYGAVTCGRIDSMERVEMQGYNAVTGEGVFGTDEHGQLAQLLVTEQTQRFISIDPRDVDMEIVEIEVTRSGIGIYDYDDDDDDAVVDWWVRYTNLTIGAATIVATPALQQAVIALASVELPETPIAVERAQSGNGGGISVVVAGGGPLKPPAEWFDDPGFHVGDPRLVRQPDGKYACPLEVTDDGRIYGHACYWGQLHTAFPNQVVTPPRSACALAHYLTGPGVVCTDGSKVFGVGQITMGCGHAPSNLAHAAAKAHYDGGYGAVQVADVRAGQDDFGVWVAGSLRSDLTPEQIRTLRATSLSGDWRRIGKELELIAVLAGVPVPGFPISRQEALVASAEAVDELAVRSGRSGDGEIISLVAAGRVHRLSADERISQLEARVDMLTRAHRAAEIDEHRASLAALVEA